MTGTDVAGLPAELRGVFARSGISQEAACDHADLNRTTYYRRVRHPGEFRLVELERLADAAGCRLVIDLVPTGLVPRSGQTDTPPTDDTVAGLGGLSG